MLVILRISWSGCALIRTEAASANGEVSLPLQNRLRKGRRQRRTRNMATHAPTNAYTSPKS